MRIIPPPFTTERASEEALGALGWIDGYTQPGPDSDEPPRRIRIAEHGDDYVDITVEAARYADEPDKRFRITVTARELP